MEILKKGFAAQAEAMREFGYPDVTAEDVEKFHRSWLSGEDATDVVAMFCESAFKEYPQIFGRRDETSHDCPKESLTDEALTKKGEA